MGLAGKKILLTTSHKDIRSGGAVQMYLLAKRFADAGVEIHAAFPHSQGDLKERRLDLFEQLGASLHFFNMDWADRKEFFRMRGLLKTKRFDVIHTHKGDDLIFTLLASFGIKVPVFITTRGVNFPLGFNRVKYRPSKLDRIIVVSQDSKKVIARCGVDEDKIEVINGGVDIEVFVPAPDDGELRKQWGVPKDALVCSVVANLVRQKGHLVYLHAAAILRKAFPNLYHVFAGTGDTTAYQAAAHRLGVADRIVFAGFVNRPQRVYCASNISVFPGTAGEGISGVLREAMACKIPVVTTDVGGNAELVQDGVNGLVVPTYNPAALAEAIKRLCDNPDFARKMAETGYEHVINRHSEQVRAEKIFALYQRIAQAKGYAW